MNTLDKCKGKHYVPKSLGSSKSCSKRKFYSNTNLPQEIRKIFNNLTLDLKKVEETKPEVSRRKEMRKIIAEINEIDSKKK